jgi:hypothetical protein
LIQPLRVEEALRRYGVNCCERDILCYRQQAGYAVDFVERRKKRALTFLNAKCRGKYQPVMDPTLKKRSGSTKRSSHGGRVIRVLNLQSDNEGLKREISVTDVG